MRPIHLLLVEDNPGDARLIRELLAEAKNEQFLVQQVDRLSAGLSRLAEDSLDAVLLDLSLPDSFGLDTLSRVHTAAPEVAVVVLTGVEDEELASEAVRLGAQDYLSKGRIDGEVLGRSLRYALDRQQADNERAELARQLREANGRLMVESVKSREMAEESERATNRLRAVFEQAAVGIAEVDLEGRWVRVNQKLCDIVGYAREELTRKTLQEITHPEDLNLDRDCVRRLLAGEITTYTREKRYLRKDGSPVWVNLSVSLVRDASGNPVHFVLAAEDIAGRKQAEEERESLLAQLTATLTSSADGILIHGLGGRVTFMNSAAEQLLGYSREVWNSSPEARVKLMRAETPEGKPLPEARAPTRRALRGETVRGVVAAVVRGDGRRIWLSLSAAPIRMEAGEVLGAVTTFTDITELRRLQEGQEDLVRMVSHDLRSPLTAIQGQAQLLPLMLGRPGQEERLRRSAQVITTSTRRMNAMIQDLVDMARVESGQMKLAMVPTDLAVFAIDLKARLETVLDTSRLWVEAADGSAVALADHDRLDRVLTNLLSNALKYSEGQVTVRMKGADGQVKVSVIDCGPGLAPEDLPHLFDRFYRSKGAARGAEGLGLGLYIARMLVEAMGGRIWVESEAGQGSSFTFTLRAQPVA